jgi:hypothetical protein
MKFNSIAFIGDSFTWGEGLEFYQEIPKWIEQREHPSSYPEYRHLIDDESNQFRESNRFAGLVTKYYNTTIGIDNRNGGSFKNAVEMLEAIQSPTLSFDGLDLNLTKFPNAIIFQFSVLCRNSIHFHLGADTFNCHCELCEYFNKIGMGQRITFDSINMIHNSDTDLWKKYFDLESIAHIENWLKKNYPIYYTDRDSLGFTLEKELTQVHFDFLINNYFKPLEEKNVPIFFIDSWELYSSESIFENQYIKDRIIPLLGYNGKHYLKYLEWEKTFPSVRISDDFPKTENGHPTKLQHQYLAKSIINHLDKIEYKINLI